MERSIGQAVSGRLKPSAVLAANYRERASELRELATFGRSDELDHEMLDLAEEYDALAEMIEEHEPLAQPGAYRRRRRGVGAGGARKALAGRISLRNARPACYFFARDELLR
jgi:hypothetical protein